MRASRALRRGAPQTALKTPSTTKTSRTEAMTSRTRPMPEMAFDSTMKSWIDAEKRAGG